MTYSVLLNFVTFEVVFCSQTHKEPFSGLEVASQIGISERVNLYKHYHETIESFVKDNHKNGRIPFVVDIKIMLLSLFGVSDDIVYEK